MAFGEASSSGVRLPDPKLAGLRGPVELDPTMSEDS